MTRFGYAAFAVLLLLSAGCENSDDITGPGGAPPGAMRYSGYDESGRLVVTGWLYLDIVTIQVPPIPLGFGGTWSLRALASTTRIGPQNGRGELTGRFTDVGVAVELQPGQADDNVSLIGTLTVSGADPMRYAGTWQWITLAGVRAEGTFRASQ